MISIMKKIRHIIENIATVVLLFAVRSMPYRWAVALGGAIGGLIWRFGIRRKISRHNLELCLPEFEGKKADKLLAESYRNFCRSMVEFALLPKIKGGTLEFVGFDGLDKILDMTGSGQGMLLVTGHFGSWELLGAALSEAGLPLDFLVGEQTNHTVDDLINGIRSEMGIGIIHMGVAARGIIKSIRSGRAVAMLSDQDAGKSSTIIDFFGHPAATPGGIGAFAIKLRCPIAIGAIVREGKSTSHRVDIQIYLPDYDSLPEDKDRAIREITQEYTTYLENYIRENPEMYFWPHRRFKSTLGY